MPVRKFFSLKKKQKNNCNTISAKVKNCNQFFNGGFITTDTDSEKLQRLVKKVNLIRKSQAIKRGHDRQDTMTRKWCHSNCQKYKKKVLFLDVIVVEFGF